MSTTTSDRPDTVDRSPRESIIRDLYALAAFYVAHPDHPLPRAISVHHYVRTDAEVDQVAGDHADQAAVDRADGGRQAWFDLADARAVDVTMFCVRPGPLEAGAAE